METIPDGLAIVNRDGAITFANTAAERILGLSRAVKDHLPTGVSTLMEYFTRLQIKFQDKI